MREMPKAENPFALGRVTAAYALSVLAHGALLVGAAYFFASSFHSREAPTVQAKEPVRVAGAEIEIELPALRDDGALLGKAALEKPVSAPRGGAEAPARPDMERAGRGGEEDTAQPAFNLADTNDGLYLTPEPPSRVDRNQLQRVHSAEHRASRENWRASREPMELTFVASGSFGNRPLRLKEALRDPSAGRQDWGAPERLGGPLGANAQALGVGENPRPEGAKVEGGPVFRNGRGLPDAAPGDVHSERGRLAFARPMVERGTPSVPAIEKGRPHDTVDSEQELSGALASIVHASSAGGIAGAGVGGERSKDTAPASGGNEGLGSRSKALGTGIGPGLDNDAADRRRNIYLRSVMAKIHPLWAKAFPKWAALQGLQGTVIISFEIRADGSVVGARVARTSRIEEFDQNCLQAVLRAAPFGPLPSEMGSSFRWSLPFEARNPAVRPKTP